MVMGGTWILEPNATAHVCSCECWLRGRTISICLAPVLLAACHEIQWGSVSSAKSGDLWGICQKCTFVMQSHVMDPASLAGDEAEDD